MPKILSTTAKEAYDLLKGLHECSTSLTLKSQPVLAKLQQLSKQIQEAIGPDGLDQLYAQAEELEVQIQQIKEHSATAKQYLREIRHSVKTTAQEIQQIAAEANVQISSIFSGLPTFVREKEVAQVITEMDLPMQGWQQAIDSF